MSLGIDSDSFICYELGAGVSVCRVFTDMELAWRVNNVT